MESRSGCFSFGVWRKAYAPSVISRLRSSAPAGDPRQTRMGTPWSWCFGACAAPTPVAGRSIMNLVRITVPMLQPLTMVESQKSIKSLGQSQNLWDFPRLTWSLCRRGSASLATRLHKCWASRPIRLPRRLLHVNRENQNPT